MRGKTGIAAGTASYRNRAKSGPWQVGPITVSRQANCWDIHAGMVSRFLRNADIDQPQSATFPT